MRVVNINMMGVFRTARTVLKHMYPQGHGSIVNCASILGNLGQSMQAAYSTAKGGVINMTRTLAIDSAPKGVRVNAVSPGYIDTPLLSTLPNDVRQGLVALHPIGRLGRSEEAANAVIFWLSDEASFVTGANLLVDGGFSAAQARARRQCTNSAIKMMMGMGTPRMSKSSERMAVSRCAVR